MTDDLRAVGASPGQTLTDQQSTLFDANFLMALSNDNDERSILFQPTPILHQSISCSIQKPSVTPDHHLVSLDKKRKRQPNSEKSIPLIQERKKCNSERLERKSSNSVFSTMTDDLRAVGASPTLFDANFLMALYNHNNERSILFQPTPILHQSISCSIEKPPVTSDHHLVSLDKKRKRQPNSHSPKSKKPRRPMLELPSPEELSVMKGGSEEELSVMKGGSEVAPQKFPFTEGCEDMQLHRWI